MTWATLLELWGPLEADLHSEYGIDLDDKQMLRTRSWRWLETRIYGLLEADTRLKRAVEALLKPPDQPAQT